MYFQGNGIRPSWWRRRARRPRASVHVAPVGVEVLGDRFLLSGTSEAAILPPISSMVALRIEAVASRGETGHDIHAEKRVKHRNPVVSGTASHPVPAGGQNGDTPLGLEVTPGNVGGASFGNDHDRGGQAESRSGDAPLLVFAPSPIPSGLPARGIFEPSSRKPDRGDGLATDPVATNVSPVLPNIAAPTNTRPTTAASAIAERPFDIDATHSMTVAASGTAPIEGAVAIGWERAELPELPAAPAPPSPSASRAHNEGPRLGALGDSEAGALATAEHRRAGNRLALRIAAYGAVSLMINEAARGRYGRPAPGRG